MGLPFHKRNRRVSFGNFTPCYKDPLKRDFVASVSLLKEFWIPKLLLLCLSFYFHSILVFLCIKISTGSSKKCVSYGYEYIQFPFLNFQKIQQVFLIKSNCVYPFGKTFHACKNIYLQNLDKVAGLNICC